MKKIFAFVGSSRGEKSNTFQTVKMLVENLEAREVPVQADIYTADKVKIEFCAACLACSCSGICPLEAEDDMGLLKQKMREADLIIFASPNYERNVSGQMKTFLDRLYPWYHTLEMAGKAGLAVMASGGPQTGLFDPEEGGKYLSLLQTGLGIKSLGFMTAESGLPGQFWNPEKLKADIEELADRAYPYLSGEKKMESDENLEFVFKTVKQMLDRVPYFTGEKARMEAKGWLHLETFAQVLEKVG